MARRESSEAPSGDGNVTLRIAGAVAHVLFDRPWTRNAMTWAMYDGLAAACAAINENSRVRVAVLRGAGGKAFVAGTDIAQFREFANGDDGVAYEAKLDGFIDTLERLRVPSIAVVEGFAVGAGLAIANASISVSPPPARGSGFRSHAPWATAFRLPISVGFAPRWGRAG
jgi:enoyl-CoA hydratase